VGFVRRALDLEDYLVSNKFEWNGLGDADYKRIYNELNSFIDSEHYTSCDGNDAFDMLSSHFPFSGYIFSAPRRKHLFSIYECGGRDSAFIYSVKNINSLNREKLNNIECVVANEELSFACMLNHEWRGQCPELYVEKDV
jgi:hypothetical protein